MFILANISTMGNINCFVPKELPLMVFDMLEFHDLHNLYCTSTCTSKLVTDKRLKNVMIFVRSISKAVLSYICCH